MAVATRIHRARPRRQRKISLVTASTLNIMVIDITTRVTPPTIPMVCGLTLAARSTMRAATSEAASGIRLADRASTSRSVFQTRSRAVATATATAVSGTRESRVWKASAAALRGQ
jgi:hypothetical protein